MSCDREEKGPVRARPLPLLSDDIAKSRCCPLEASLLFFKTPRSPLPERPLSPTPLVKAKIANERKREGLMRMIGNEWVYEQNQETDDVVFEYRGVTGSNKDSSVESAKYEYGRGPE